MDFTFGIITNGTKDRVYGIADEETIKRYEEALL